MHFHGIPDKNRTKGWTVVCLNVSCSLCRSSMALLATKAAGPQQWALIRAVTLPALLLCQTIPNMQHTQTANPFMQQHLATPDFH